jgi:hypothetical protein
VSIALLEDGARSHRADSRKLREQRLAGEVDVDRIQIDDDRRARGVRGVHLRLRFDRRGICDRIGAY